MSFFVFALWLSIHTLLINIAIQTGWNHDPGYLAPAILVFVCNLTLGLYMSNRDK